jgi:hypothetical protein
MYYPELIDAEYRLKPIPEDVRKNRNLAIIILKLYTVCLILSLGLFIKRRSRIILAGFLSALVFNIIGYIGVLRMRLFHLFVYSFFTVTVIGAFYVYLLIDYFIKPDKDSLSDSIVMFILSLPFLLIFVSGIHSLVFFSLVYEEHHERNADLGNI